MSDDTLAEMRAEADRISAAHHPYGRNWQNLKNESEYLTDEPHLITKLYQESLTASRERRRGARTRQLAVRAVAVVAGALCGCGAALLVFAH
jgi:ferric-dicitrate binding protein FerR (iron transport regulator)